MTTADVDPGTMLGAVVDVAANATTNGVLDDLAVAASLGITAARFDVPWAAAQPKGDALDGDVIEQTLDLAAAARGLGLQPWVRLLQPRIPRWFDNEGGFADARNAGHWWPRWVEAAADALGDAVAGWVPFEAPFAMAGRLIPDDPRTHGELIDTLTTAWRDAWRILRGGPPVMTSIDVVVVRPVDDTALAAQAAQRIDQLRWEVWLGGLRDGVVRIPGRADRVVSGLDGACDVLGLALRADVETALYRAAEQGPERPLAITFRPQGDDDAQRTTSIESMWRGARRAAEELPLHSVTITPFIDRADARDGIVTRDGELKDSGQAFLTPQ